MKSEFRCRWDSWRLYWRFSEPRLHPWASKNSHSKEQEMKIILSTFNLSTPEARWSCTWRLCDRLHWSLLNQFAAIYESAEVIQKIRSLLFSLKILKLTVLIFKNRYLKPPHPTCVQSQILNKSPTVQDEVIHTEDSFVHPEVVKNLNINVGAKLKVKIDKKSKLQF